jgi:sulfide:quinone oxidoreductase
MQLPYEALVVATGAGVRPSLPGATRFRGLEDLADLRAIRQEVLAGEVRSVAFTLPSKTTWALPLYELALAMGAEATIAGLRAVELTIVTPEQAALAPFGPAASDALAPLLAARGVKLRTGVRPVRLHDGVLQLSDGRTLRAERVVTLGEARGRPPVGLASDRSGFLKVDDHGVVLGGDDVFAAGDVAAHRFKQGGLAAQQADAVAEAVAARLGFAVDPQPYRPILRGLLLTGDTPLYLRAATDPEGPTHGSPPPASVASWTHPLWEPLTKVASKYLSAYWVQAAARATR